MPRFLPDSSCMVAALLAWHEHHERAAREIERRLDHGEDLVLAAPALVETYAVLTRLPPPHRLSPADTRALLDASFMRDETEVVGLPVGRYLQLLRSAPERQIVGGRTYDAVIAECARLASVQFLLTFNDRHFRSLAGD